MKEKAVGFNVSDSKTMHSLQVAKMSSNVSRNPLTVMTDTETHVLHTWCRTLIVQYLQWTEWYTIRNFVHTQHSLPVLLWSNCDPHLFRLNTRRAPRRTRLSLAFRWTWWIWATPRRPRPWPATWNTAQNSTNTPSCPMTSRSGRPKRLMPCKVRWETERDWALQVCRRTEPDMCDAVCPPAPSEPVPFRPELDERSGLGCRWMSEHNPGQESWRHADWCE